eukprot:TRINITY_DN9567_c1_g1_i1.p1 TRINITY_DN9567_c1_g1~~TRINITY_DN9567_c1_g1_i1.p1  ORF type:complete len:721 (+),score=242.84 TRINITY_DN9567_c1_g1_i1:1063-3225(+)
MLRAARMSARVALVNLRKGEDLGKVAKAAEGVGLKLYVAIPMVEDEDCVSLQRRLGSVYHTAFVSGPDIDTLVLLNGAESSPPDASTLFGYEDEEDLAKALSLEFKAIPVTDTQKLPDPVTNPETCNVEKYKNVCMGGTFDRLHIGQKLLLSIASTLVSPTGGGRLFCGIAGDPLFKEKALRELIQPFGRRARTVATFLSTINPKLPFETGELIDGYGPSVTESSFEAIIVTEETKAGGDKCNAVRAEKGMPPMDVVITGLIDSKGELVAQLPHNEKLSSTGLRQKALMSVLDGGYLMCRRQVGAPYIVGLTGGIATGKTTASKWLEEAGAEMVDADKLGHSAYAPGTEGYELVKKAFPEVVVDGEVDRRKLGGLVFGCKEQMKRLTDIVWPIIAEAIKACIAASTAKVLVLEAAVLVEAGWTSFADEVWLTVAPPNVAKQRLIERNNLTEEEADKRMASQITGLERMGSAHILLSNHKGFEEFRSSIDAAWHSMVARSEVTLSSLDGVAKRWAGMDKNADLRLASHWWRVLRDGYMGLGRYYHNLHHLEEMFEHFDALKDTMARPDLVAYAIYFHDAVYDATAASGENEKASSALWRKYAGEAGIAADDTEAVAAWIDRTANHLSGAADGDLAVFLDIDLAVLGRDRHAYFEYAQQISMEYAHVPNAVYFGKRAEVLQSFLTPERLYFTDTMHGKYGARARENITQEIEALKKKAEKVR